MWVEVLKFGLGEVYEGGASPGFTWGCCWSFSVMPLTSGMVCDLDILSRRFLKQQKYSNRPTIAAMANALPAAPPAIAATGVLLSGCEDAVADEDTLAAVTVASPVDVGDEVAVALEIVVEPPVAWYALSRSGRFRIAFSRSPSGQPPWAHGFVLQQPQKVWPAVHV